MKKTLSLILALAIMLSATVALAASTEIDGTGKRNIKIKEAGLNTDPQEMIDQHISPTTGRNLDEVEVPAGFVGAAFSLEYRPVMVQVSNAGGGVGESSKGDPLTAPINAQYADVVYEACQANTQKYGGSLTRFSMIFSDVVPDYVGFVRSTRLTHVRLRQEWDCAFCTSGYSEADVLPEWRAMGLKNPAGARTEDIGLIYVGDFAKSYSKYVHRLAPATDANSELFELANIVQFIIPKDHKAANHTWLFTDEQPEGGDTAKIVDVKFGGVTKTDSRLEYDDTTNTYFRYVPNGDGSYTPFRTQVLINPHTIKKDGVKMIKADAKEFGDPISFTNVIVQGIVMHWRGGERPDPALVGSGNADYFMGGKHYTGVWERKSNNSRTVYYDENGEEIELLRGKTLIILMDYNNKNRSVKYE